MLRLFISGVVVLFSDLTMCNVFGTVAKSHLVLDYLCLIFSFLIEQTVS